MPLQHGLVAGLERSCLQHEAWTWDLVRLLFEALPSEPDLSTDAGARSAQEQQRLIAALDRRAALSRWLQVHSSTSHPVAPCHAIGVK